jgi:hypothetical protein
MGDFWLVQSCLQSPFEPILIGDILRPGPKSRYRLSMPDVMI